MVSLPFIVPWVGASPDREMKEPFGENNKYLLSLSCDCLWDSVIGYSLSSHQYGISYERCLRYWHGVGCLWLLHQMHTTGHDMRYEIHRHCWTDWVVIPVRFWAVWFLWDANVIDMRTLKDSLLRTQVIKFGNNIYSPRNQHTKKVKLLRISSTLEVYLFWQQNRIILNWLGNVLHPVSAWYQLYKMHLS